MMAIETSLANQKSSSLKMNLHTGILLNINNISNYKFPKFKSYFQIVIVTILWLLSPVIFAAELSCNVCHSEDAKSHQMTAHGQADVDCKACHGSGEQHVESPNSNNISTFSTQLSESNQQYSICSNCHNNTHNTNLNAHSAAAISCGSCHSLHSQEQKDERLAKIPQELKRVSPGSSLCYDCHQDSFIQFEFNERHRLTEGVLECTSCHDPHNPQLGLKLGGFKQSVCSDCHADVAGPFVFEHSASRVEGCVACHEPHGSPNRHMLKIQEVGALCYSCHADAPQFHIGFSPTAPPRFNESTVCTNCHVSIHGSNLDSKLLR
jgi:DmsE family decaheme c-type cytochrome